jgi:hypothetical protein
VLSVDEDTGAGRNFSAGTVAARYHLPRLCAESLEAEATALLVLLSQVPEWAKARLAL